MSSRFFRINFFLYTLETFASVFGSREAIVLLQSFAQKFSGSFLRTGDEIRISFAPKMFENLWLTVMLV